MKSVLVIGMGRFGRHLAIKMQELGDEVLIIDKDPELVARYSDMFTDAQVGDCTNEDVIVALGIDDFDICFVTIGEDFQSSLVITSLLKQHNAKHIVSKTKQDIQADLLRIIGADEIIYPEKDMAERIAVKYNTENILDYIPLTGEYSIYEIPILKQWVGVSISDINVRKKYKMNIVAIKDDNGLEPMPDPNYTFKPNDIIIVIGKSEDVFRLTAKK